MDILPTFLANGESTKLIEPCHSAFDHPAMTPESLARFLPLAGDANPDAASAQVASAARNVIGLIAMQFVRSHPALAAWAADRRNRIDQLLEDDAVMPVGTRDPGNQWRPVAVGNSMALRAWFAAIRRVWPGRRTPFFAGMLALSIQARSQSIAPAAPISSSNTRWKRFHTPAVCQSRSRLQQVMPLPQPSSCGSISHGMPLLRTKTIPVRQARSGRRDVRPSASGTPLAATVRSAPRVHRRPVAWPCDLHSSPRSHGWVHGFVRCSKPRWFCHDELRDTSPRVGSLPAFGDSSVHTQECQIHSGPLLRMTRLWRASQDGVHDNRLSQRQHRNEPLGTWVAHQFAGDEKNG